MDPADSTQTKSETPVAVLGMLFARAYFNTLPVELPSKFYREDSQCSHGDEAKGQEGVSVAAGVEQITKLLSQVQPAKLDLTSIDSQRAGTGIFCTVLGTSTRIETRRFCQSFFLEIIPGTEASPHYYVKNDIFRFLSMPTPTPAPAPESPAAPVDEVAEAPLSVETPEESPETPTEVKVEETPVVEAPVAETPVEVAEPVKEVQKQEPEAKAPPSKNDKKAPAKNPRNGNNASEKKGSKGKKAATEAAAPAPAAAAAPAAPLSWASRIAAAPARRVRVPVASRPAAAAKPAEGPGAAAGKKEIKKTDNKKRQVDTKLSLCVLNIPFSAKEPQLKSFLTGASGFQWKGISVVDLRTGYALVEFENAQLLTTALEVASANPAEMDGRPIRIERNIKPHGNHNKQKRRRPRQAAPGGDRVK